MHHRAVSPFERVRCHPEVEWVSNPIEPPGGPSIERTKDSFRYFRVNGRDAVAQRNFRAGPFSRIQFGRTVGAKTDLKPLPTVGR